MSDPIVTVRGLEKWFPSASRGVMSGGGRLFRVLEDISFDIRQGETLGLVGESGSGKSTLGRCIMGIHSSNAGEVVYTARNGKQIEMTRLRDAERRMAHREIRMIFQDPFSSLNPRMNVLKIIGDPLYVSRLARGSELEDRVAAVMRKVGLSPDKMRRYPHAFSGGERQRINIARALIMEPRLVIADEAVSALDVSIRAQVLDLLGQLQADLDLTYLFISHDLSVVEGLCDRVVVMNNGRIVELEDTEVLYTRPANPYTRKLLTAVPIPDPRLRGIRRRNRSAPQGDHS